jgi:AcrR family transcriptional regulator
MAASPKLSTAKMEQPTMNEHKVKRDPEGTRRRILEAATQQFSTHGLSGARVDAIATAADTNERMLYYYFQSKEGLYIAVLEAMYGEFANHEVSMDLSGLPPVAFRRKGAGCFRRNGASDRRLIRGSNGYQESLFFPPLASADLLLSGIGRGTR